MHLYDVVYELESNYDHDLLDSYNFLHLRFDGTLR